MPLTPAETNSEAPAVNRKKQKRRQKQAAKLAAEQPANGAPSARQAEKVQARYRENGVNGNGQFESNEFDTAEGGEQGYYSDDDGGFSGSYGQNESPPNGYSNSPGKKSKKKKKNKGQPETMEHTPRMNGVSHHNHSHMGHHHAPHHHAPHHHAPLDLPPLQPNMPRGELPTWTFQDQC